MLRTVLNLSLKLFFVVAFFNCSLIASAYIGDYDGVVSIDPIEVAPENNFVFDCNDQYVVRQRIEVGVCPISLGKTDWSLTLRDTLSNDVISIRTRLIEQNKYDFDHNESVEISLKINGELRFKIDMGNKLPISKSPIHIRAQFDGDKISVSAGDSKLHLVENCEYHGFINNVTITSKYGIIINRYSSLHSPQPFISQIFADENAVYDALIQCTDSRCGIWDYFDEEVDTKFAIRGGRYKVALLPSDKVGYDIIYLSGAEIEPFRWQAGARKGYLTPTPFANTFNLYWVDSTGKEISDQSPYAIIDGAIMTLYFPLQKAKIRFVRSN